MARILREIKGGCETDGKINPRYYDVWTQVNGFTHSWKMDFLQFEEFSVSKGCLKLQDPEYYIFLYRSKFYLSEIELSDEEFIRVLQKEVLSKKGKLKDALEKIMAEAETEEYSREPIAEDVQMFVWQRDGGKCVNCDSNENLEYDHIIPVSKGGSNTARNIQLLCQTCNRLKSNKIGGQSLTSTSNITESAQEVISDELELSTEGSWKSVYEKAKDYYVGRGLIERDRYEAFKLFNQAEKLGCIQAYWMLGKMLVEGEGVKKNKERALLTFKKGINHGDYRCWAELALLNFSKGEFNEMRNCWAQYFNSEHFKNNITYELHLYNSVSYSFEYLIRIYGIQSQLKIDQENEFFQYLYPLRKKLIHKITNDVMTYEEIPFYDVEYLDMLKRILTDIKNWE